MVYWKEAFDKSRRPTMFELRQYLTPQAGRLLDELNSRLYRAYRVKATPALFTQKNGWVVPYRLQGARLFSLTIQDDATFWAGDVKIQGEEGLQAALAALDREYHAGFSQRVEAMVAARKERARQRRLTAPQDTPRPESIPPPGSDPEQLNKFHWVPALPPSKLRELYRSSARGTIDPVLLEDVGTQFYCRCRQGAEEYELLRAGRLKCHQCGEILPGREGLIQCPCGRQYTFREYERSFLQHRMPGGSALSVFQEYVEKWPKTRTDNQRMMLVDWMIHQCHISMSSGLPLRSILKNLIDAPQKTAEKLVLTLAYGDIDQPHSP